MHDSINIKQIIGWCVSLILLLGQLYSQTAKASPHLILTGDPDRVTLSVRDLDPDAEDFALLLQLTPDGATVTPAEGITLTPAPDGRTWLVEGNAAGAGETPLLYLTELPEAGEVAVAPVPEDPYIYYWKSAEPPTLEKAVLIGSSLSPAIDTDHASDEGSGGLLSEPDPSQGRYIGSRAVREPDGSLSVWLLCSLPEGSELPPAVWLESCAPAGGEEIRLTATLTRMADLPGGETCTAAPGELLWVVAYTGLPGAGTVTFRVRDGSEDHVITYRDRGMDGVWHCVQTVIVKFGESDESFAMWGK